jgi:hypothetical protein
MTERKIFIPSDDLQSQLNQIREAGFSAVFIYSDIILYAGPKDGLAFPAIRNLFPNDALLVEFNFYRDVWEIVQ